MDGDNASQERKVLSTSRSNIPRPTPAKAVNPQVSATIQAARNLKRRSIEQLSVRTTGLSAKKAYQPNSSNARQVTAPLPNSMRTGRVTMAGYSNCSRYSNTAALSNRRVTCAETTSTSQASLDSVTRSRKSRPSCYESTEVARLKADLELSKSLISLKDQTICQLQAELELIKSNHSQVPSIAALQVSLETEKNNILILQNMVNVKDEELARLRTQLEEGLEEKGCLVSRLAAAFNEVREKEESLRLLHNTVVDLKGQIRVAVRVRPLLGNELDVPSNHLSYPGVSTVKLDQGKTSQTYEFQRVFGPTMSQARVFDEVQELVLSCLHGYNVSIIAYGQTGSGKTHTMRGGEGELEGIIPRTVKFLLQSRNKLADLDWEFKFKASFLEVYNEEVYDLLAERKKLDIKLGSGNTSVDGLKHYEIGDVEDIESILYAADRNRSTAATKLNQQSSRSHALFEIAIHGSNKASGASRCAVLHLVDLAGSERVKDTCAEGQRFKELTYINSALSNLQNCIRSQLKKSQHIPYRDSKLTMLLRESLGGGNSKTMVIVNVNPALAQISETKRSLEFAQQMSTTKIGAAKKQEQ